ncbi:hypothetical protein [Nocardioides panaciterrulae]|uniref:Uncharacterized protein n=1 Tax=Nocardioides panaciterrulae TaxID=661492 RepID=A0A7Y9E463_9ACTN|nr:hypothetical protein [Nocardioides panaciterrulae]NYD40916.1 hypothetical protein [Nocardioides panaciterrulae]
MCRPVVCKTCGKTGWAGCGMHVDQVLAGVPASQRCPGHPKAQKQGQKQGGFLGKLFGR